MRLSWISLDGVVVKRILATSVESVLSWTVGVTCSGSYSSFRAISVAYFMLASSYGAPLGRTRVMVSTTSGSI